MSILSPIYRNSISFFKEDFLRPLSSQQKKILVIASIAFGFLTACCFLISRFRLKSKITEVSDTPESISDMRKPLKIPKNIAHIKGQRWEDYKEGMTTFSFEIFQKFIAESQTENLLVSPLGISLLLAMIKHGISQDDQEEIERIIYLPQEESVLQQSAFRLIKKLTDNGLDFASLLYLNGHYRLNPEYKSFVSQHYQAKVVSGFTADPVNAWVKTATNGQVKEIISQNDLINFSLVLVNTIHFKGIWAKPFKPGKTYSADFMAPAGKMKTPMMHIDDEFEYFKDDKCQAVRLPYSDKSEFSMLLVLPKENNDFSFVENLSLAEVILEGMAPEKVQLAVPKFKIEQQVDVKEILGKMGVVHLFENPDFSKLVDLEHPATREVLPELRISKIVQKSVLACDEEGTEASSVTAEILIEKGIEIGPEDAKIINFNRPFIAALLFQGGPIQIGLIRSPTAQ